MSKILAVLLFAVSVNADELLRHSFAQPERVNAIAPKRSRAVEPDLKTLTLDKPITITLFNDAVIRVQLAHRERNAIGVETWRGRIDGGHVLITTKGDVMTATIITRDARYLVQPAKNAHEVIELDDAAFPAEAEPVPVMVPMTVAEDSGDTIDMLVAYTSRVRHNAGGTAAAETLVSNAVALTNTAFENSAITPRVRLVGTTEITTYDEGAWAWGSVLSHLTGTSDGNMDSIHALRDELGADVVGLLIAKSDQICGIANVMSTPSAAFAASAFNVTRYDCAIANYSFPHELGHNLGVHHDRAASAGSPPSYPWGYGYVDSLREWRDIMAYPTVCTGQGMNPCPRIPYFSNPDLTYSGRPLGVHYLAADAADVARAINLNAQYAANWRQAVDGVSFTDDPLIAGTTAVKAIHLTELRDAVNAVRSRAGLSSSTWSETITAGDVVKAAHVTELRDALTPALQLLGVTPAYTDDTLTVIKAVHIQELRGYCM